MPFDATPDAEVTARDRMIRLRDFLTTLRPEKFMMQTWMGTRPECGTVACIGGWARILFDVESGDEYVTGAALGLSEVESDDLFFMMQSDLLYQQVTIPMAVAVLDHYLANGVIDWAVAKPLMHKDPR